MSSITRENGIEIDLGESNNNRLKYETIEFLQLSNSIKIEELEQFLSSSKPS
jgi:hypothetical protein